MSTDQGFNPKSDIKGIMLTIEENGRVKNQIMGQLNEAEFLGLGTYLTNVLMKDGILALSQNQIATAESLQRVMATLEVMQEVKAEEEEECGKELCSGSCHSQDSGPSSENCQEDSGE